MVITLWILIRFGDSELLNTRSYETKRHEIHAIIQKHESVRGKEKTKDSKPAQTQLSYHYSNENFKFASDVSFFEFSCLSMIVV